MKTIFLEIDGVIIHETCHIVARVLQKELTAYKRSVDALNMVVAETKAQVIVTSARRAMGLGLLTDCYRKWGVQAPIDVTPTAPTKLDGVRKWLEKCTEWGFSKPDSFVIIDFEDVYGQEFAERLIITNANDGGLNEEEANRAIEILRK